MTSFEYQSGPMTQLAGDLNKFHTDLHTFGGDVSDMGNVLAAAWEGNEGHADFQAVHQQWDGAYHDGLVALQKVAAAVENALHRALSTDHSVGQGFSSL
ncbi:WXG100 family type VII secretion target [Nocardia aurantia]|uniref:ESAT-6-like protein n=1 Tax=Nocardia aurantia TaxID=2585199 RepID=A0A7K0DGT3_9NOCA|nr:hypothetical protein [Nocardia aurantia]MQY25015.1 hypothetical protein [Nocardia aurantia]